MFADGSWSGHPFKVQGLIFFVCVKLLNYWQLLKNCL